MLVLAAIVIHRLVPDWRWAHHPFHSLIEGSGAFIALIVAMLISLLLRYQRLSPRMVWVASALLGMGVLDGFHAATRAGQEFVWLHSAATLVGGALFALVWLPRRLVEGSRARALPLWIGAAAVVFGTVSIVYPTSLPVMVNDAGFSGTARFTNIFGGLCFLVAGAFFALRDKHRTESLVLTNHCFLFGISGIIFEFSVLWDGSWWLWHFLRFVAYLVILYYFFFLSNGTNRELAKANAELREHRDHLGDLVKERTLAKRVAIASNEARGADEAFQIVLECVCEFTKWPVGHVYVPADDGSGDLAPTKLWHLDHPERFKVFKEVTEATRFAPGVGLPGRVLAAAKPAWIVDVTEDRNFPRAELAHDIGVRAGFGFPVLVGEEVVAVLEFFSEEAKPPNEALLEVMEQIGIQLGIVVERQRVEKEVRQSEEKYRSLVVNATYGIYRSTRGGRFLSVNPAMVSMLGYDSEQELLDVNIADDVYLDPENRAAVVDESIEADRADRKEVQWRRKDGTPLTVVLSGLPVRNAEGEVECFDMIAEDVTEQRKLESQLRQAQKMEAVGQLTGGIAHDFNNLLTVILANADLIASPGGEDGDAQSELEEIQNAALRGTTLIKKLLGFSRRDRLEFKAVDLSALLTELSAMLRRVVPENIEIKLRTEKDCGSVLADAGAVEQIVFNLTTNARDAMPDGGTLTIVVERSALDASFQTSHPWVVPGEYICVSVSDTGIGMDEPTKQRIFEPFFTTKPPGTGTGLGMAMIYGLAKQHNGFVHVYSELGKGTKVRVYFPLSREGVSETGKKRVVPTTLPLGTETILVVEDEAAIRLATKRALEAHGYTVLLAEDGEEGLEIVRSSDQKIDLVISDLIMPKLGGRQFHDALREQGENVAVLFSSGYSADEVYQSAILESEVPFIAKPWTIMDLLTRVREVLDEQPAGRT